MQRVCHRAALMAEKPFFFGEEKRGELSTGFCGLRREARKRSLDGYCNGFATVTVDGGKAVFFGEEKRDELSTGFCGLRGEARRRSLDGYCNGFAAMPR